METITPAGKLGTGLHYHGWCPTCKSRTEVQHGSGPRCECGTPLERNPIDRTAVSLSGPHYGWGEGY